MNPAGLLFEWIGLHDTSTTVVKLGYNQHGTRGLLASQTLNPDDTVLVLPWKFVLGTSASFRLLQVEQGKGRTMFSHPVESIPHELSNYAITDERQVWSCVMACAILAAVRYPLSSWGPFISCLPSSPGRIDTALRICHAYTAKWSIKTKARDKLPNRKGNLSQEVVREASAADKDVRRTERDTICNVLLWTRDEVASLNDEELEKLVELDWAWLRLAWKALIVDSPCHSENDDNDEENKKTEPLVSWPSWLWAHAIIRSRAVGMPLAPRNVLAFPPTPLTVDSNNDDEGDADNNLSAIMHPVFGEGVLLPIIDLINHGGAMHANAALDLRPEGVVVVAKTTISADEEVLFDYHPNATLRCLLRGYGFVDCFSNPIRQIFRVEWSRIEIDVTSTFVLMSCIDSLCVREDSQLLPVMRVVAVIPSPRMRGGIRFVIRDDCLGLGGPSICSCTDRFADEGWLCGAAAACCSIVLDGMEQRHLCNDTTTTELGKDNRVALSYRTANLALLRRCIDDLTSLATLLEMSVK